MSARPAVAAVALVVALAAASGPARAQDAAGDAAADDHGAGALELDRVTSGAVVLAGGLVYILSEAVFKDDLAPGDCRWCGSNGLDDGVRDALVWDDVSAARSWSNVTGYVGAPAVGMGLVAALAWRDGAPAGQILDDQLIIAEAMIAAVLLNQGAKLLVGRARPFVHHHAGPTPLPDDADDHLSFYSGHSSLAFSLAVAGGTVATLRGYRGAPWIWASGLAIGVATGWLRIAGDKHYFTDVLTGAAVGGLIGFAMPYWLHRPGKAGRERRAGGLSAGWTAGGPTIGWYGRF